MKKLLLSIVFCSLLLGNISAQKEVNVSLKFKANFPEEMASVLPEGFADVNMLYKGDKTLSSNAWMKAICDYKKGLVWMILDMSMLGGEKTLIEMNAKDYEKTQENYSFEITNETKKILGYNTKKIIMTMKMPNISEGSSTTATSEIWVTDELGKVKNSNYKDIDGVPLEMTINGMGMNILCHVTEIKKGSVKDSDFDLPKDINKMTLKEFLESMNISENDFNKMMGN